MLRLSIIIPFYNVEQYIAQCLDSVYQQDIPEEEYEVICVNDASPDGSREIVKEYQKKHTNLILIEHEKNKKLGAARNTGRKIAKGRYLWNVDSDDMIAPNCLKEMLETCEKNELDVLMFGVRNLRDGKLYNRDKGVWDESIKTTTGFSFMRDQGKQNPWFISAVWTQIYRRAFLDEQQIHSPEINMGEDVPYTYASIVLSQRMMAINVPYYIYRDNTASLTGELRKHPNPQTVYENSFVCSAYMYELQRKVRKINKQIEPLLSPITRHVILLYTHFAHLLSKEERMLFLTLCRKNYLKNLFVYTVMNGRQRFEYTKFIFTGIVPQYR